MKTVCCVFGTRPEAVKMAPVILELMRRPQEFRCCVVVTAQHRHMLDQVMSLFRIKADHDLNIMTREQTLTTVTVRVLQRLEPVLKAERPDIVLVHGDTTTTMAAALASFYLRVPVGHVEAGLRSYDKDNPFPEEMNRLMADSVGKLHFAPTSGAKRNLLREGIPAAGVYITGNTGIDALRIMLARISRGEVAPPSEALRRLTKKRFILVTAHRRENFGEPFAEILRALADVAERRPDLQIIYPVHPNPNISGPAQKIIGRRQNVHLLPSLGYSDFIYFMARAKFLVTDSGGLQEEGPSIGKPVLVLREVTERPEAVRAGIARIVGTKREAIYHWISKLLDDPKTFNRMANVVNPYGDGHAARRTVEAMRYFFGLRRERSPEFKPHLTRKR